MLAAGAACGFSCRRPCCWHWWRWTAASRFSMSGRGTARSCGSRTVRPCSWTPVAWLIRRVRHRRSRRRAGRSRRRYPATGYLVLTHGDPTMSVRPQLSFRNSVRAKYGGIPVLPSDHSHRSASRRRRPARWRQVTPRRPDHGGWCEVGCFIRRRPTGSAGSPQRRLDRAGCAGGDVSVVMTGDIGRKRSARSATRRRRRRFACSRCRTTESDLEQRGIPARSNQRRRSSAQAAPITSAIPRRRSWSVSRRRDRAVPHRPGRRGDRRERWFADHPHVLRAHHGNCNHETEGTNLMLRVPSRLPVETETLSHGSSAAA